MSFDSSIVPRSPLMRSIAVYLVQLAYGGPEEGGWYYQTGELCTDPELTAFGTTFTDGHEARAKAMADEVQVHLDRDWNTGDHARAISSGTSAGDRKHGGEGKGGEVRV